MSEPSIILIRELEGQHSACLVRRADGEHFVVSSASVPWSGYESLAFPADADGHIISPIEVAGGPSMDRDAVIAALAAA